ncbi:MAG: hypothetical protein L0027_10525, partial [Candidatus Rokubacteria bacterium]|nr:hypothetical protein [Candidatus Rokubacteria bacterium]
MTSLARYRAVLAAVLWRLRKYVLPSGAMLPERPEPGLTPAAVAATACLSALLSLAIVHAVRAPYPAGDDMTWLRHASAGLGTIWSGPSPFHHFRPSFGTWLAFWQAAGLGAPRGLALVSLALHAAGGAAAYALFRAVAPPATSLLAATLFLVHPAREQHLLWASAQIDGLGTALALAALALSLRARGLARGARFAALLGVALLTFLAALAKETGLLLPLVLVACPLPAGRRLGMVGASAAGALAAATLALGVLGGLGRAAPILEAASPMRLPLYPTRLVWPGDLVGWTRALRVDHDPL